ncbi:hypothetical protein HGRIS_003615 [Hohenbuehelia grisea]|uniref:DNA polymerase eta n=1 Tax=Hohenbuehelia grisea TaxID=104357 RepID=A0ABR3JG07_9AGAR
MAYLKLRSVCCRFYSILLILKLPVEKASIDEAFFDLTRPVREILLQRFPLLAQVPPEGIDSPLPPPPRISWEGLGYVIPIDEEDLSKTRHEGADSTIHQSAVEASSAVGDRESPCPSEPHAVTWHDVALSIGAELMQRVRDDVRTKLGYSTSAGIARNKFLAKLSASYRKLNSQSILRNAAIPYYLRPMSFQKIRWLGGKLGKAIAEEYEAQTVGDLLSIGLNSRPSLEKKRSGFGRSSEVSINRKAIKAKAVLSKSMGASKNLPQPVTRVGEGKHWIRVLAAELALRLRDARKEDPTLWPKTIVLGARKGYSEPGRSKQAPFPFMKDITVDAVAAAGEKLWREYVGGALPDDRTLPMKITHMHLGFSGIATAGDGQGSIEGFFRSPDKAAVTRSSAKRTRLSSNIGDSDIEDAFDDDEDPIRIDRAGDTEGPSSSSLPSFICDRCGKRLSVSPAVIQDLDISTGDTLESEAPNAVGDGDQVVAGVGASTSRQGQLSLEDWKEQLREEALRSALNKLKAEHEDFHFAQDLARSQGKARIGINPDQPRPLATDTNAKSTTSNAKKRQKSSKGKAKDNVGGIEKFFSRR